MKHSNKWTINISKNGNQNNTHESNYIMENVSEINAIYELYQSTFPIIFNIIDQYQRKYPGIKDKLKCKTYQCGSFHGGNNDNFKPITCK